MVSLRTPPLLSPAPPSLCRTVWISRTSIFYVMNANMPNFQTSQRSLGVHRWKRGKEALKGFLYGLRRWYGWRWKGHSVIFSCRCCSFSCTLVNLPQLQFFSLFFPCLLLVQSWFFHSSSPPPYFLFWQDPWQITAMSKGPGCFVD